MRIEILATGDELVSGQLVDTNSPWLMDRFFGLGEQVACKTMVGDDLEELVSTLRQLASRADLLVVSGGLGPTVDDLTVDAVCAAFGREATLDEKQVERLTERFARMGRPLSENNLRQARIPTGAQAVDNEFGTASPFWLQAEDCEIWCLPGVPREWKGLCERYLLPRVRARREAEGIHRCFRAVRCFGITEASMDAAVRPLLANHPHVRYGTRTSFPENQVKLFAEGSTAEEAEARCRALESEVRRVLGPVVYGGNGDDFPTAVAAALRDRGFKVAFAESLTAGLTAALLADAPGAGDVLVGSHVTYATEMKSQWLGVSEETLEAHGPVSSETAKQMAEGALTSSGADLAVSLTGWAGPDGDDVGLVWFGLASRGAETRTFSRRFPFDRQRIRRLAAYTALEALRRHALGLPFPS